MTDDTVKLEYAIAPGTYLQEWIDKSSYSPEDVARRLFFKPEQLVLFLAGRSPLTEKRAIRLEKLTAIPADVWLRYETQFRFDIAAGKTPPPGWSPWFTPQSGSDKYNGKSVYRLENASAALSATVFATRIAIAALRAQENAQQEVLQQEVAALLGDMDPATLHPIRFGENCENSPTRHCIYLLEDRMKDHCIFCGEPAERK